MHGLPPIHSHSLSRDFYFLQPFCRQCHLAAFCASHILCARDASLLCPLGLQMPVKTTPEAWPHHTQLSSLSLADGRQKNASEIRQRNAALIGRCRRVICVRCLRGSVARRGVPDRRRRGSGRGRDGAVRVRRCAECKRRLAAAQLRSSLGHPAALGPSLTPLPCPWSPVSSGWCVGAG